MRIKRIARIMMLLFLLVQCTTVMGQRKKAPPEDIERCQAELDDALQKKAEANEKIQIVYRSTEKSFQQLQASGANLAVLDIARVLKKSVDASRALLAKAKRTKARERAVASFGQAAANEMVRLENASLKRIPKTVAATAAAIWSEAAAQNKLPTNSDLATMIFQRLTSETPFWTLWNTEVADDLPETKVWVDSCAAVRALEERLLVLKDPKMAFSLNAPKGMARIPGSAVIIEGLYGYTIKKRVARVAEFFIDRCEVSHGDYWKNFHINLTDAKKSQQHLPQDKNGNPLWEQNPETGNYQPTEEQMKLPVAGVDLRSALAYATKMNKRLPTEAEWILAASGSERGQARYPTGDKALVESINHKASGNGGPLPVDAMPEGRSQYGLHHVAGNVMEWTWTIVEKGRDIKGEIPSAKLIVVRGGGFDSTLRLCSNRARWAALAVGTHDKTLGFRCARDAN